MCGPGTRVSRRPGPTLSAFVAPGICDNDIFAITIYGHLTESGHQPIVLFHRSATVPLRPVSPAGVGPPRAPDTCWRRHEYSLHWFTAVGGRDAAHAGAVVGANRHIRQYRAPGDAGLRAASLPRRWLSLDARILGL